MSPYPRPITVPRLEECTASIVWHGESALLRTAFECTPAPGAGTVETFGEQMNR